MNAFQFDPNRHIPVTQEVPKEDAEEGDYRRPDIAPPSAWNRTAVVVNRRTKQRAVVASVDLVTRQMRLWYPDRAHLSKIEQFDGRTAWQTLDGDWEPEITFSPEEVERQTAAKTYEDETAVLDASSQEFVAEFCNDPDPRRKLGKLRALRNSPVGKMMGLTPVEAAAPVVSEMPAEPVKKAGK